MTVSATNRLDMLAGLRTHLGDFVADTLMEHLPPGGWYDIARTSDIDRLRDEFGTLRGDFNALRSELRDDMGSLRGEFNSLRTEVRSDIQALTARLDSTLKWIIGMCITTSLGTLGTLVTVLVTLLKQ